MGERIIRKKTWEDVKRFIIPGKRVLTLKCVYGGIPMYMTNNLFRAREEKFPECWKFNKRRELLLPQCIFHDFVRKYMVFLTSLLLFREVLSSSSQCYSISSMFFSLHTQQHKTFISERKRLFYGSLSPKKAVLNYSKNALFSLFFVQRRSSFDRNHLSSRQQQ